MVTSECIVCGSPAVTWTGHVHRGDSQVTAGWCSVHCIEDFVVVDLQWIDCMGCCGPWFPRYGSMANIRITKHKKAGIMNFKVEEQLKYGTLVQVHVEMDKLRRTQCLCLNCSKISDCLIAATGLEMCQQFNVAFAMTRCPMFVKKG